MGTLWFQYGSVFAGLTAFFLGAIGCFDASPQKQTKPVEAPIEMEPVLAGEEQPERSEESQPQRSELDDEKPGEEVVEIPLDRIWALRMPGTRKIGELEPDKPPLSVHGPLVGEIRQSLAPAPPKGMQAKSAFAVLGSGEEALRQAHAVLVENKPAQDSFPAGGEISVVFYSHQFGGYVHLDQIRRRNGLVEIKYRFVPHLETYLTEHVALIPLGNLPSGEYEVRIIQVPIEQKFVDYGVKPINSEWERRIVCKSFSFSVVRDDTKSESD